MSSHQPPPAYSQPAPPAQPAYPPPQAGYNQPPVYGQHSSTTVQIQPAAVVVTNSGHLGPNPTPMRCPHCGANIVTSTGYETGTMTWVIAGVICLLGCWAGCCLIPFCIDGTKDTTHQCPNCKNHLGRHNRM